MKKIIYFLIIVLAIAGCATTTTMGKLDEAPKISNLSFTEDNRIKFDFSVSADIKEIQMIVNVGSNPYDNWFYFKPESFGIKSGQHNGTARSNFQWRGHQRGTRYFRIWVITIDNRKSNILLGQLDLN